MLLFFDTETTGLPLFREPRSQDGQPHIVQIAALLQDDDGTEKAVMSTVIRPDGWTVPDDVAAIHGISTEIAERCGIDLSIAMGMFMGLAERADTVIAHNVNFDIKLANIALHRLGNTAGLDGRATFCTMMAATPVCKIPHPQRRHAEHWKWPKLEECVRLFFGEELAGAHDALIDVRACARVYHHLKAMAL